MSHDCTGPVPFGGPEQRDQFVTGGGTAAFHKPAMIHGEPFQRLQSVDSMNTVLKFRRDEQLAQRECTSVDHALEIALRLMRHDIARPLG